MFPSVPLYGGRGRKRGGFLSDLDIAGEDLVGTPIHLLDVVQQADNGVELVARDELVAGDIHEWSVMLVEVSHESKGVREVGECKSVLVIHADMRCVLEQDAIVKDADEMATIDLHGGLGVVAR